MTWQTQEGTQRLTTYKANQGQVKLIEAIPKVVKKHSNTVSGSVSMTHEGETFKLELI